MNRVQENWLLRLREEGPVKVSEMGRGTARALVRLGVAEYAPGGMIRARS